MPQTLHKQEKEQFCKLFKQDQLTDFEDRFAVMEAFMQTDGHVSSAQMIELELSINDTFVYRQRADGLIVSTPTGSTGHSLSAGGPILTPDMRAFVMSLICPHTLSSRPLVVPDTSEIRICVGAQSETARQG